jgi:hypothetical protein
MHKRLRIGLLLSWVTLQVIAQTPFTASWDFEGNTGGSVNSPNVSISSANLSNVNEAGYPAGATGDAISIRLWPTTGFDGSKYVEVSLTPQNYRMSITSISFDCNRSAQGPTQLSVRTNQDSFGIDIGSTSVGTGFSNQNYSVSFNDLENTVSFRIYAHTAMDILGTLRLDNLRINGTVAVVPLPVELTYFRGQIFNNQVQLSWETAWERNAAQFEVQRSSDLKEFVTVNTLTAAGDNRDRTRYTFTDASPMPGVNYYRLRQTDFDGKFEFSKTISVNFDMKTPQIWLYGNPTSARQIQVRLQKLTPSDLQLYSLKGQLIPFSWQAISTNDYILQTIAPAGWYWLIGQHQMQRISQKVLLIEP